MPGPARPFLSSEEEYVVLPGASAGTLYTGVSVEPQCCLWETEGMARGHVGTSSSAGLKSHSDDTQVGSVFWHCPA